MKKAIAILLILVIGMVGVFAGSSLSDSKSLELKTLVPVRDKFAITAGSPLQSFNAVINATDLVTEDSPAFSDLKYDETTGHLQTAMSLSYASNVLGTHILTIESAEKLKHSASDSTATIDYKITVGDASWDTSKAPTAAPQIGTFKVITAGLFKSEAVSVTLNPNYLTAPATTGDEYYQATVVFGLTAP